MLWPFLGVGMGGAVGSMLRYAVTRLVLDWLGPTVWGTFTVNITGAFVLGIIAGATEERITIDPVLRTALTVGVLGGYTTFSTLMYESQQQIETGAWAWAMLNVGGSIAAGLGAMILGLALGRAAE